MLVTPYCKRTRPGRGTNTKAAGFHLSRPSPSGCLPPSRSVSRRPIWAGARGDNLLVGPGTPGFRNADKNGNGFSVYRPFSSLLASVCMYAIRIRKKKEKHCIRHLASEWAPRKKNRPCKSMLYVPSRLVPFCALVGYSCLCQPCCVLYFAGSQARCSFSGRIKLWQSTTQMDSFAGPPTM
jgi:hypothetical protein